MSSFIMRVYLINYLVRYMYIHPYIIMVVLVAHRAYKASLVNYAYTHTYVHFV